MIAQLTSNLTRNISVALNEAEQIRMLNDAARVFKKEADANRKFLAQVAGKDIGTREFKVAGKTQKFTQLDPLIDSQLANFVKWPDIDSIRQLTGKTRNLFSGSQNAQQLRTVTTDLFDSFFKQTVLVGRVSYILRNIGDMQVRSFLGGSTTLFNHPLQFAAMMMANPEGNAIAKFATRWSRFDNTVFGTNFNKAVEEMDAIGFKSAALADADKFAVMMSRSIGVGMGQGTRGLSQILPTGMRFITPEERGFNRAWAGAILQFRESAMARLVAGGLTGGLAILRARVFFSLMSLTEPARTFFRQYSRSVLTVALTVRGFPMVGVS